MRREELFHTDRLTIRNWRDQSYDHEAFFRLNSDETVMKHFPFRRTREEAANRLLEVRQSIHQHGYSFAPVIVRRTGKIIGMAGLLNVKSQLPFAPALEIGWRLLPEAWGNGYATEAANGWLKFAFENLDAGEVVSFATLDNGPSIAVMQRLGMSHDTKDNFDYPGLADEYAHIRPHVLYRLNRDAWIDGKA